VKIAAWKDDDFVLYEISRMLETLNLPNLMETKEFLNIPEEKIIYEVPEDITEFIEIYKKKSDKNTDNLDEMDDSTEVVTVSINVALKNCAHIFTSAREFK
jgi:hypothetical protein